MLLPLRDLAILFNLLQSGEHGLVAEIVELLPAEIIAAAFHVADPQRPQMLFQKWDVFEENLLLQIFRLRWK